MNIWIFIVIILILVAVLLLVRRTREPIVGICAAAIGMDARKRELKEKILTLLAEKNELSPSTSLGASNSDIREALKISERSVVRYLDELEKEGRVEQVGSTGRSVVYRLK